MEKYYGAKMQLKEYTGKRSKKRIPAGSGLATYRSFEMQTDESIEDEADYVDLSELKKLTNAL